MNAKNLFITVGVAGSGKSTYLKNNVKDNGVIVSRDAIRFNLLRPGDDYFSKEKEVFNKFTASIQNAFNHVDNVYADATHLNERSRNKLLNALNLEGIQIHYLYFLTPLEECLARNKNREGMRQVPESAIKRMYYSMSDPMDDEKIYPKIVLYINQDGEVILTKQGGLLV